MVTVLQLGHQGNQKESTGTGSVCDALATAKLVNLELSYRRAEAREVSSFIPRFVSVGETAEAAPTI